MVRGEWLKYFTGELNISAVDPRKKANILYRARQNASECMKMLTLIFDGMEKVTDDPGKQFWDIFEEGPETKLLSATLRARLKAQLYGFDLMETKQMKKLIERLMLAEIEFDPIKLLRDKEYYREKMQELSAFNLKILYGEEAEEEEES